MCLLNTIGLLGGNLITNFFSFSNNLFILAYQSHRKQLLFASNRWKLFSKLAWLFISTFLFLIRHIATLLHSKHLRRIRRLPSAMMHIMQWTRNNAMSNWKFTLILRLTRCCSTYLGKQVHTCFSYNCIYRKAR